jgi:glutathione S-transferase
MMDSVLRALRRTGELAGFKHVAAYVARGESRPAFRAALADHMAVFDAPAAGRSPSEQKTEK